MRTLIRGVRVFDGTTTTERADVLIDGDRIAAPDDAPVDAEIDGTGKTLLPGLIDAHTHVFDGDLAQALAFGVTTELDMFCLPANLARQRRAADRDDAADLRSAATLATAPGGHPSQIMTSPEMRTRDFGDAAGPFDTVRGPQQAEAFVQARLAEGADYLKIVIDSGTASGAPLPVLTLQTATALVEAAHAAGLRVIAHAVTVDDTLTYFEALTGTGEDRELLRDERIRSRLPAHLRSAADRDTDAIPVHAHGAPNAVHAARTLHDAGVRLLADTDANPFAPPARRRPAPRTAAADPGRPHPRPGPRRGHQHPGRLLRPVRPRPHRPGTPRRPAAGRRRPHPRHHRHPGDRRRLAARRTPTPTGLARARGLRRGWSAPRAAAGPASGPPPPSGTRPAAPGWPRAR